ncbi:MAG: hypothetical protein FJ190_01615 [Gammaproteobacteria bacterium]|nr:hypothetical protein [Gammaproteobacteria bacterium]
MALHFDYALRLRSNSVKTPGLYGYAGVVVHRSASLASMYSFGGATGKRYNITRSLITLIVSHKFFGITFQMRNINAQAFYHDVPV